MWTPGTLLIESAVEDRCLVYTSHLVVCSEQLSFGTRGAKNRYVLLGSDRRIRTWVLDGVQEASNRLRLVATG